MANAIAFDTLAYAKKLIAAGFTQKQAEVQAEALSEIIDERLATKQDVLMLQKDIQELEIRLKHDLTIRFGAMLAATIAILAALITMF